MRIYTRIVMDMATMQVEEAESFEYQGEVARCGGGNGGDQVDKDYNRRIANIAEAQQGMAEDMFNMYKHGTTTGPQTQYNLDGQWVDKQTATNALSGATDLSDLQTRSRTVGGAQREGSTFGGREVTQYNVGGDWLSKNEAQNRLASSRSLQDLETRTTGGKLGGYGTQLGLEQAQIEANMGLIPYQTNMAKSQMQAQTDPSLWSGGSYDPDEAYLQGLIKAWEADDYTDGYVQDASQWTPEKAREAIMDQGLNLDEHRDKWQDHHKIKQYVDSAQKEAQQRASEEAGGQVNTNRYEAEARLHRDQLASQREILPEQTGLTLEQLAAQREILPEQTGLTLEQIEAQRRLLPQQTELTETQIGSQMKLIPERTKLGLASMRDQQKHIKQYAPVRSAFFDEAMKEVDPYQRANQAQADVTRASTQAQQQAARRAQGMGLDPSSGRFAQTMQNQGLQQARAVGDARTQARRQARDEQFGKLNTAMGLTPRYGGY